MSFLCKIGVHEWKWKYIQQGACEIQELCAHCGKAKGSAKVEHRWEKAYTHPNSCEMQDICTRCGATSGGIDTVHQWEWVNLSPCTKKQSCKRCGAIGEIIEKEHRWVRSYIRADSCETQETCESCGTARGPINLRHDWQWEYPKNDPFVKREVCRRCKQSSGKTDNTGQRLWNQIYGDADKRVKYLFFQQLLSNLARVNKFWFITDEKEVWNTKRNAGATATVTRQLAKIVEEPLPYTSIVVYGILFQAKYLFFLPDNVLVLRDRNLIAKESVLASSDYRSLKVSFSTTNFRETDSMPSDSEVIGYLRAAP